MFENNDLLYIKIAKELCLELISNEDPSGAQVPSVRELAKAKKVNPNTVQKAYKYLDELGIFYTKEGKGRYLTDDDEKIKDVKKSFLVKELKNVKTIATNYSIPDEEIYILYKEIDL